MGNGRQPAFQQRIVGGFRQRSGFKRVQQQGVRRPHRQITQLARAQAQVHVGTLVGECGVVEAVELHEQCLVDQQAAVGHRRVALRHLQAVHVARRVHRQAGKGAATAVGQAGHEAGMGDLAVGGNGLAANNAHFRALAVVEQFVQPLRLQGRNLGAQEQQVITCGLGGRDIAGGGMGQRRIEGKGAHAAGGQRFHLLHPLADLGSGAVVDQQQFVIRVTGFLQQRHHAAFQQRQRGIGGHNQHQRNRRLLLMPVMNVIQAGANGSRRGIGITACVQMAQDGALLEVRIEAGRGSGKQRLGQVLDALQPVLLHQAQNQIQLGRIAGFGVEAAKLQHGFAAEYPMPAEHGRVAEQQVEVEIRAHDRGEGAGIIAVPLVGIQQPLFRPCLGNVQQQLRQTTQAEFTAGLNNQQPIHRPIRSGSSKRSHFGRQLLQRHASHGGRGSECPHYPTLDACIHLCGQGQGDQRALEVARLHAVHGNNQNPQRGGVCQCSQMLIEQRSLGSSQMPAGLPGMHLPRPLCRSKGFFKALAQVHRLWWPGTVQRSNRHDVGSAIRSGLIPAQAANAFTEIGMALFTDAGLIAAYLAELLRGNAKVGQRCREHGQIPASQQLCV